MSEYDDAAEEVLTERGVTPEVHGAEVENPVAGVLPAGRRVPTPSASSVPRSVNTPSEARLLMDELGRYGHFSPRGTKCKLCGKEHK